MTYELVIGGVSLLRDGQLLAAIRPCADYKQLSYVNVQAIWHWLEGNQEVQTAIAAFNNSLATELITLGDTFGLHRGRMSQEQYADMHKLIDSL